MEERMSINLLHTRKMNLQKCVLKWVVYIFCEYCACSVISETHTKNVKSCKLNLKDVLCILSQIFFALCSETKVDASECKLFENSL